MYTLDEGICIDEGIISSFENGQMIQKIYHIRTTIHRNNGPAVIRYYSEEQGSGIYFECYYHYGIYHRQNGPAIIFYDKNGTVTNELYYIHGSKV
jgi:hypothetical protein